MLTKNPHNFYAIYHYTESYDSPNVDLEILFIGLIGASIEQIRVNIISCSIFYGLYYPETSPRLGQTFTQTGHILTSYRNVVTFFDLIVNGLGDEGIATDAFSNDLGDV